MSGWSAKRVWTETRVEEMDGGFTVQLDGRAVKTPAKTLLVVPTRAMADQIAAEWEAQQGKVDPRTMPWTRSANAAIDKVATQFAEVAGLLAAYGDTDLLCYRAGGPAKLVLRQAEGWDGPHHADDGVSADRVPRSGCHFRIAGPGPGRGGSAAFCARGMAPVPH